jgi:hypothetical protein
LGLLGIQEGGSASLDSLTAYKGKIVSNSIAGALNKSSVPIDLKIGLLITGDVTITTVANVESDTSNNVAIAVRPSKTNVDDAKFLTLKKEGNTVTGATLAEGPVGLVSATNLGAFALNKTGVALNFLLGEAKYQVKHLGGDDYIFEYDTSIANGNGTAITIEGVVNSTADWTDYVNGTKTIGLAAVFSFEKADPTTNTYLANADLPDGASPTPAPILGLKQAAAAAVAVPPPPPYGFKASTGLTAIDNSGNIADPIGGSYPLAGTATFTVDAAVLAADPSLVSFNFDFNNADVSDIWWSDGAGSFAASLAAFDIDTAAGTITFGSMWSTAVPGTHYEYINLDDGGYFLLKIVLN